MQGAMLSGAGVPIGAGLLAATPWHSRALLPILLTQRGSLLDSAVTFRAGTGWGHQGGSPGCSWQ